MATTLAEIERTLWNSADQMRANSSLRAADYSSPVLGLIFLRFADVKVQQDGLQPIKCICRRQRSVVQVLDIGQRQRN
jgi:type I restriction enzyme M protein